MQYSSQACFVVALRSPNQFSSLFEGFMDKYADVGRNHVIDDIFNCAFWCPVDSTFNEAELALLACKYPIGEPIRPITLFSCIHRKLTGELMRFPPKHKGAFDNKYLASREGGGLALEMANTIMKIAKGIDYNAETSFWLNRITPIHAHKARRDIIDCPSYQLLFNVWATTDDGPF